MAIVLGLALAFVCQGSMTQAASQEAGAEADQTVLLTAIEFKPNRIKVSVGDRIRFINRDLFEHDIYVVRTANRSIVQVPTTTLGPGESVTVTIKDAGLFTLYCTIHGGMSGKITTTGSFELSEEDKEKYAGVKVIPPIVKTGEELFWDRAQCHRCHQIGDRGEGLRGPNLEDIGFRAAMTAQKLELDSATAYIIQSIIGPSDHIVEGFSDDMPKVYQPPIGLNGQDIKAIVTYLQSQGGEVDTWAISINEQKIEAELPANPFGRGDPERGALVFETMGCFKCHTVGDRIAISAGPELTAIGAYRNWTWLAESVIDPNAEIGANWQSADVYLQSESDDFFDSDTKVSGILRKNSVDEVQLLIGPDEFQTFPGDRVLRVEISEVTNMPADYTQLMTFQQMADLVRYLESLIPHPSVRE